jgi:fumarate hydratase class II
VSTRTAGVLWGAQTDLARAHFEGGDDLMPLTVVRALARIKQAAAAINQELGLLDAARAP